MIAEGFESGDKPACGSGRVAFIEVIAASFAIALAVANDVKGDDEHAVGERDGGFLHAHCGAPA